MKVLVVGGGISGLATAFGLVDGAAARGRDVEVQVFEAADHAGGTIGSDSRGGAVHECGPNGWLSGDNATDRLVSRLELDERRLVADPAAARRFVLLRQGLVEVPTTPRALLASPLLSWPGKFRVLAEPFIPRRSNESDESIGDFGRRRLGAEVVDHILDPFLTGIYAGDVERTSLTAAFPRIAAMERHHGSLLRAAAALGTGSAKPRPVLTSLEGGMGTLVDALVRALGDRVRFGRAVRRISPAKNGGFRVASDGGDDGRFDRVVLAVPAPVLADVCADFMPEAAAAARDIPYVPVAVVETIHRRVDVAHDLDGFGFLCSRTSGRSILGTIWSSSVFPGRRAPDDHVALRSLVGGTRLPALVESADLVDRVMADLGEILGVVGNPVDTFVRRWRRAIPQYEIGHLERVATIDRDAERVPGICVIGNAFRGVAMNDCTAAAEEAVQAVLGTGP